MSLRILPFVVRLCRVRCIRNGVEVSCSETIKGILRTGALSINNCDDYKVVFTFSGPLLFDT